MVIIINIFISLLFLSGANCQLAYSWLVYRHLQCLQNTRNVHELVKHQYMCIFSHTYTCVVDSNTYSYRPLYLDHFCGFINSNYVAQNEVTWNINVKPNIHIYFQNFSLSSNYWYCDFEYLQVITSNRNNTFCGTRLPWVHDATDSSVKIIFCTKRFGSDKYQLQFQYYGAYVTNYQHFVIFTESTAMNGMHRPNVKENEFETFHFISSNRLDTLYLAVVNACSTQQVVCYDGPGIKSPILQCRDWACQSSTFQMVCLFSRSNSDCSKAPSLHYHAMTANITQLYKNEASCSSSGVSVVCSNILTIKIEKIAAGRGTSKFIYSTYTAHTYTAEGFWKQSIALDIKQMDISFPYMLYEGKSCMYGGVYIIDTSSSDDGNEIISLCDNRTKFFFSIQAWRVSILIIHYEKYAPARINFHAEIVFPRTYELVLPRDAITIQDDTMTVTASTFIPINHMILIKSYLIDIRKIQYIQINVKHIVGIEMQDVEFSVYMPDNTEHCVYCTVSYAPQFSNLNSRKYDWEIFSKDFKISERIQSAFINMSACGMFTFPIWSFGIRDLRQFNLLNGYNKTFYELFRFDQLMMYQETPIDSLGPLWWKVQIMRPPAVPHYAIWKVRINMIDAMSYVSMEVLTDTHWSSSVYKWDHHNYTDVYMVIDGGVNFFFSYADSSEIPEFHTLMHLSYKRHFINDLRKGETYKQIIGNYMFHNWR